MKVSLPKSDGTKKVLPPLPLIPEDFQDGDETKLAKIKQRTEPTDAASPTYDFKLVKLNGTEPLRAAYRRKSGL